MSLRFFLICVAECADEAPAGAPAPTPTSPAPLPARGEAELADLARAWLAAREAAGLNSGGSAPPDARGVLGPCGSGAPPFMDPRYRRRRSAGRTSR